ncbi:MAG: hypothetical protein WDN75_09490 [Bacteroidota bacterium]
MNVILSGMKYFPLNRGFFKSSAKIILSVLRASIFLWWSGHFQVQAQTDANQFTPQVSPLAPNAASLAKFVDIPVSYYTGTPQIGIPIYEIKAGSLSLPVALAYHASELRSKT